MKTHLLGDDEVDELFLALGARRGLLFFLIRNVVLLLLRSSRHVPPDALSHEPIVQEGRPVEVWQNQPCHQQ